MEKAFIYMLLNTAAISSIVSDRIYWIEKTQSNANPYVVLQVVTATRGLHYASHDGHKESRVQVDCWAKTFAQAKAIGDAIQVRALNFIGTIEGVFFQGIFLDSERHGIDAAVVPDKLFRVSIDLIIWHKGI